MQTPEQLLLNVRPRADIRLGDFAGDAFGPAVAACRSLLQPGASVCYLWGGEDAGRAALLAALAQEAGQGGGVVVSVLLADLLDHGVGILAGLEDASLLIVDGLGAIAGLADWEEGLFHLYNRARGRAGMLFAAVAPVAELGIRLPDLLSRLHQATPYPLPLPDDRVRFQVLEASARRRGLVMTAEARRYLVERGPRSLDGFLDCIEMLDRLSLQEQRRLTLPFLRQLLVMPPGDGAAIGKGLISR